MLHSKADLFDRQQLDINAIKRARAQFELKFLSGEDDDCPEQALRVSADTLNTLMVIVSEHDSSLPENSKYSAYTTLISSGLTNA